jgi:PAS domain S-box-containing protein
MRPGVPRGSKDDPALDGEQLRLRVAELEDVVRYTSSLEYLRATFDDMFEGMQVIDFEWRYVYLNKTAARHGRRPREGLLGQRMSDVYPGITSSPVFSILQRCMLDRVPQQAVMLFTYPDERTAWFELRINPVPQGILVLSVDISEQKAAEEQLRRSREDLATTLDCMGEGVITTDIDGRITRMNAAAEKLVGWNEPEVVGRPLDELVYFLNQRTQAPVPHPVEKVLRHGLSIGLANDTVLVTRTGERVPIASSGAPMRDAQGSIRGVVLVIKNMKEEYELAAMLQHSQKMEAIGRLACGVAHDFNNLLTVIIGYSEMLLADAGAAGNKPAQHIREAADRASELTRQLLAFGRKQVLQPCAVNLNEDVQRVEPMLRRLLGEDIDLVARPSPDLAQTMVDRSQLEQIIMNLAVNARDAMPEGGKLTIETATVVLDEEYAHRHQDVRPGPYVMLAMTDTGIGMDPATMAKIFEPFFTTKAPGKGTGLGLATIYGIVKQSGGHIWVYSELGRGTTFKVYLPRSDAERTVIDTPPARVPSPPGTETILLVEDDAQVRELIRAALESAGYVVLATGDAQEALQMCTSRGGPIHLLLTDLVLPKMGGRELMEKVRGVLPGVKVVFMSGYTEHAMIHHGVLEAGTAFLEKPISPSLLLERIRHYLG